MRKSESESPADTRERLLDAAIEAFARGGFEGATVREVCRLAGASINAVNYHFGDKENLYVEAVKAAHRQMRSKPGVDTVDQIAERLDSPPEVRLREFIGGMVAMAMAARRDDDTNHQLVFREMSNPTVATEHVVREAIQPQFSRLMRILQTMLPPDNDPIDARLLAMSVVGQCLHYMFGAPIIPLLLTKREHKALTPERVADHICGVTLAAVRERFKAAEGE